MTTLKKTLGLTLLLGWLALGLHAAASFTSGTKYRITCRYAGEGSVTVGALHGSDVVLLYQDTDDLPADGYWLFESTGGGDAWRIKNAVTGQYLQYSPQRIEGAIKGLILSDDVVGDSTSWTLRGAGNRYNIVNVADPKQWLNLRTDGTWLLGTYEQNQSSDNEVFSFYDESGEPVESESTLPQISYAKNEVPAHLDSLYVNGRPAIYDQANRRYLCTLPDSLRGTTQLDLTFDFTLNDEDVSEGHALEFNNAALVGGQTFALTNFSATRAYTLLLHDETDATVARASVEFTFLPVVVLNTSADCNGTDYTPSNIRVIDPATTDYAPVLNSTSRYRGATAQGFQKKAFAVKLKDAEGESMDWSYFGLREDNNWILDAMAVDVARMRNRVSTDLWNAFSTRPYYADEEPEMNPGTRGRFVEVVLNGNYHGLYCMTEKLDRKQLKLKKIKQEDGEPDKIRGVLYKSGQWSYEVFMGHESDSRVFPHRAPSAYNNNAMEWCGFEMDYPDLDDDESIDWGPLYNAIDFVATSSDTEFANEYQQWFDMPVWRDYYLFLDVILATDNHGKNMFLMNYNISDENYGQLMTLAPWDLDGTWGRRWDGSNNTTAATSDFDGMVWQHEHGQLGLFHRLQQTAGTQKAWEESLAERYADLRPTAFNPDSLKLRFTSYYDLMYESGAVRRETRRWAESDKPADITTDVRYITRWIDTRIATLDKKYGYDPTTEVGINSPAALDYTAATGGKNAIHITATRPTTIHIYNVSGKLVRSTKVKAGATVIENLAPGVYLVGKNKVSVY